MTTNRTNRRECQHPNRQVVRRRIPSLAELDASFGITPYRCPDCGLLWNERRPAAIEGSVT